MSTENIKTNALVSLKYVVMSFLNAINDYSLRNYKRYLQFAIEGFTELNIKHTHTIEVAYLTVDTTTMTAVLPSDMIDYRAIGVIIGGQVWTLTRKDELGLPRAESCGVVPKLDTQVDIAPLDYYNACLNNHAYIYTYFGMPGGSNEAYYRIDWERRLIILAGSVRADQIVLEYTSTGVSLTQATNIPRECVMAIRAYMNWMRIENDRTYPMNDKQSKKFQWEMEVRKLYSHHHSFTADEFIDSKNSTAKQSPKR
jgi:hypothetical protein